MIVVRTVAGLIDEKRAAANPAPLSIGGFVRQICNVPFSHKGRGDAVRVYPLLEGSACPGNGSATPIVPSPLVGEGPGRGVA
ncbi:hypothetical protein KL86PLE_90340 [uncultured Pleomorphomonas sp.]|uniref:Uncharacterized protein n=1 Tax=uncultured Pleomorphomonas sp. TaxID=442121 RepID=A0A212LPA5_9HYPH|nr:hypothetical protein KL86PLE_90340 [uncultured Pleomorphomonas sp.]